MSNYHFDESISIKKKKKKEELQKIYRDKELDDLKKILSFPEGRRFLWKVMSESGVFRTSFTGNSETFFNEGKRSIGLLVLSEVNNADMGKFSQMQIEFYNEQKKRAQQLENLND